MPHANRKEASINDVQIQDYPVTRGVLLVKPKAGLVVVSDLEWHDIYGISSQVVTMREIGDVKSKHDTPGRQLKARNVRLPAEADEIKQALIIIAQAHLKNTGLGHHKANNYEQLILNGNPKDLAKLVAKIYSEGRGKEFRKIGENISSSESEYGQKGIRFLAQEMSLAFDLEGVNPKTFIQSIVSLETEAAMAEINRLKPCKDRKLYLTDEEYTQWMNKTIGVEPVPGIWSGAYIAPAKEQIDLPVPHKKNPQDNKRRAAAIRDENAREAQKTERAAKQTEILFSLEQPKKTIFGIDGIRPENVAFHEEHQDKITSDMNVKAQYVLCALHLPPTAFEIHARLYFFKNRQTVDEVAKAVKLPADEIIRFQKKSIARMKMRVPALKKSNAAYLKEIDKKDINPPSKPPFEKKVIERYPPREENKELYNAHIEHLASSTTTRGAFVRAAHALDKNAFELHTRVHFARRKQNLHQVAQSMRMSFDQAKDIHNQSVMILRPYYTKSGRLIKMLSCLKLV